MKTKRKNPRKSKSHKASKAFIRLTGKLGLTDLRLSNYNIKALGQNSLNELIKNELFQHDLTTVYRARCMDCSWRIGWASRQIVENAREVHEFEKRREGHVTELFMRD